MFELTVLFKNVLQQVKNPIMNDHLKFGVDTTRDFEVITIQSLENVFRFIWWQPSR